MVGFEVLERLYGKKFDIRFCAIDEIDGVLAFIDTYWKKGHVLTRSKKLLDWQHLDTLRDRYNFVLAAERTTGEIYGIYGFILSSSMDSKIAHPVCWGAIWQTRPDAPKGLGLYLKLSVDRKVEAGYFGSVRLNENAVRAISSSGWTVYGLSHFYMLNNGMREFRLASFAKGCAPHTDFEKQAADSGGIEKRLKKICNSEDFCGRHSYDKWIPAYKSKKYYLERYARHPVYKYDFYEVADASGEAGACIILRVCGTESGRAISIVDYIGKGSELKGTYGAFQELLHREDAEYISFYEYGLDADGLRSAGFNNVDGSGMVIPLYFEPFEQKNVELNFYLYRAQEKEAYDTDERLMVFRGDGDADRPNLIISA